MKLGVMTVLLGNMTLKETLSYLKSLGVQQVEIGCGGTPGTSHADAVEFMENPSAWKFEVEESLILRFFWAIDGDLS